MAGLVLSAAPLLAFAGPGSPASAASPTLVASPNIVNLGDVPLGTGGVATFTLQNTGSSPDTINLVTGMTLSGPGADDWLVTPDLSCQASPSVTLVIPADSAASSCVMDVIFLPGALGDRTAQLTIQDSADSGVTVNLSGTGGTGYYEVDANGDVLPTGDAGYYGDTGGLPLNNPIVGIAATGDDGGYWLVASDGGIFTFGDAGFYGSMGGKPLNKPVVGMAGTPDGGGYWQVATDGGIFTFGDAPFYGSTGSMRLNQPIVGMASTPDGLGYWLVASDGGIFSYGDAAFHGSMGGKPLNKPVVGMASTPDGGGYWLVASDGGIFSFGDARFFGSTGSIHLNQPITAMASVPDGGGYWFSAADGGLFTEGDAPFYGSAVGLGFSRVVGIAADGGPTFQALDHLPALRQAHLSGSATGSAPLALSGPGRASLPIRRFAGQH